MFLSTANAVWPKRFAIALSNKIEPNHFLFVCAPRIGSGALALPMSGMVPRQGNKRSNRNTQPVATGVAEATKGDAKPQGKEAAPPSQGPAVPPEAETSQEAASSQAQAETSASAEPSGAQAAEQPSAENGSTPKKGTSKKPGRASPGSVHSAPAMPPRDKGKGKGQSNPPAPGTFPQPSLPLPWWQDPYGNWWYFDGYNWWMGYRTSSGGQSGPQPTGASQTSSGWTKLTGGTWMHPDGTIYGQPSQEPVSATSGKKTTPKKEEKPEESGGREKKKDKQPGKKGDKQEPKKTKPKDEPPDGDDDPDWGGDDDGGDGDSDYTYEYEEEGGEEEFAEEDQSLVVTPRSERPSVRRQGSVPKAKAAPRPEPKAKAKAKAGNRPRQEVPPERSPRDRTGSAATLSAAASDLSSIRTESVRELLRNRSSDGDRSRPNIGNVKLETFRGDRNHYKDWIKIIQAQRRLYQLRDGELAVLIFLSCEGEARQVLNQLEVDDMQSEGGLGRMLRLLDDAFGSKADERFEERQGAYLGYKRLPGLSIAAYVATLKRLREEYLKEDAGTTISDKAFAQRLLQRAGLTRRERYDVFFAAGGAYKSAEIERVLRFRCAHVHKEEHGSSRGARRDEPERASASAASRRPQQAKRYPYKRGDRRKPPKPTRYAHVADNDDEVEEDPFDEDEDEDFENEDPEMEALVAEGEMPEEEEWSEEDEDLETMDEQALTEAFTAGWRAKQRTADARKSRGFKPEGKGAGKGGGDRRTPEDRKKNSTCASCGEKGHWRGDPVCRNVQSGKDPVHKKESGSYYARSSKSREVKEETPAEEMRRRKAAPWSRKPPEPEEPPPERPPLVRRPHVALPVETPRDAPPTRRKHDEVEKSKVKDSPDRQKQRTTLPGATAKSKTRPETEGDPPRRRRSHREGEDRDRSRRRRRRKSREERGEEAGETPASTPRTERSDGESRAPVEGGEDVSTRQVNWTLVHGWSFLKEYDSNSEAPTWESEDESSEEPDVVARFKLQDQENKREARTKLKAKLLTVLKSLADDEEDEQLRQRIRKKEKRVAREVGSSHSIGLWPRQVQVKATIKAWQRCGIRAG